MSSLYIHTFIILYIHHICFVFSSLTYTDTNFYLRINLYNYCIINIHHILVIFNLLFFYEYFTKQLYVNVIIL